MYTGTLISGLMAMVDQAEQKIRQQKVTEELHEIFTMQIPVSDSERAYMGAA
ncbi:MAG: hypothetical protein WAM79_20255 [Candidatus Sulfotelmatobacter sp.]